MIQNSYTYNKANAITKFFWNACGAEIDVLERCGNNDRVKYFCLGGIVLATGIMAGFAGGYAFYTIFQPKSYTLSDETHTLTAFFSILFGVFWGLMIFNLDRYIVASSGIGDGTEKITWSEFKTGLPRLIMGVVIAITISKPVEIRIFKTEIDNALYKKQLEEKLAFTNSAKTRSKDRRERLEKEKNEYVAELKRYKDRISQKEDEAEKERLNRGGRGFETNRLEKEAANLRAEKDDFIAVNAPRINNINNELSQINLDTQNEQNQGDKVAQQLDGLLQRIKLSHEIAGWPITIFITLLFMVIELTPIFFKMMVVKSNYDIMLDDYKKNILIQNGIAVDGIDGKNHRNLIREEMLRQMQRKVELEKDIFEQIYEKHKSELSKDVKQNYQKFISSKEINFDLTPTHSNSEPKKNNKNMDGSTTNPTSKTIDYTGPNFKEK